MAGLSNYMRDNMLKWMFNNTVFPTKPTTVYFSLHTGDPGLTAASAAANEVGASVGYARQPLTNGTTNFSAPGASGVNELVYNLAVATIVWGPCTTTAWGTIVYGGIWDASTSGNLLWSGTLAPSVAVTVGGSVTITGNAAAASAGLQATAR